MQTGLAQSEEAVRSMRLPLVFVQEWAEGLLLLLEQL